LEVLARLTPKIDELSRAIQQEAEQRPEAHRLMTHPGVGRTTALAFVLILGVPKRFPCGKQVASYLGLIVVLGWLRTVWDAFDRTMGVYWSCDHKTLILTSSMPWE
jgi:hypothetical protein